MVPTNGILVSKEVRSIAAVASVALSAGLLPKGWQKTVASACALVWLADQWK